MNYSAKELVYSKNVLEFATVAKEFCAFLENATNYKRSNFVGLLEKLLPLVFYKATLLPVCEPLYEEGTAKYVTEKLYESIYLKLVGLLKQHDTFPEVFDTRISETDEPFSASISEYLADVYQDLKNFTVTFQTGQVEEMNDALWECQSNFREFWGIRIANTLRAVHILNKDNAELDADDDSNELPEEGERDTTNWFVTRRQKDIE